MNISVLNNRNPYLNTKNSITRENLPQKAVKNELTEQNNKILLNVSKDLFTQSAKQINTYAGKGSIIDVKL